MANDILHRNAIFDLQSGSSSRTVDITVQVTNVNVVPALHRIRLLFSSNIFSWTFSCCDAFILQDFPSFACVRRITLFDQNLSSKSQISCCRPSFLSKFLLMANLLTWICNRKRNADYESRESRWSCQRFKSIRPHLWTGYERKLRWAWFNYKYNFILVNLL